MSLLLAKAGGLGIQGPQGAQGATGAQGSQGATGAGTQGATGAQGSQGATGAQGSQGATGAQGSQGATGAGTQGAQGATGAQGSQGATGAQGSQGATGAQGETGAATLSGNMTGDIALNDFNFALKMEPTSDDTASGWYVTMTVDSNSTGVGCPLYMAADGHWDEADASSVATAPALGIAMETSTGSKKVLVWGVIRNDGWNFTTGPGELSLVFLSTTVGEVTQTAPSGAGEVIQAVGYALSDDVLFFCPQLHVVEHT